MDTTVIEAGGRHYQAVPRPNGTTAIYAPHGPMLCEPCIEWAAEDPATGQLRAVTNDPARALGYFVNGLRLRPSRPGDVGELADLDDELREAHDA